MTTEELIDGLSRLAKIMGKAEFRDWSAWCRNAAEDLLRRKEVVVVKHTKYYSRITDISAFWGKELAKKSLQASLNCRLEVLRDLGYTPTTIAGEAQYEINAADGNIYYEWEIESIPIAEDTEGDDPEITSQYQEYLRRRGGLDSYLIKLLAQTRAAVSPGATGIPEDLLGEIDRYISRFSTEALCPRCGKRLFLSDLPQYAYVCYDCDENYFDVETATGGNCHERNEATDG